MTSPTSRTLTLTIPGKPMGKQRPKFARKGNFVTTRTPEKTVNYETYVKTLFVQEYPDHKPLDCPVSIAMTAFYPIPKSTSQKKRAQMLNNEILPTKKPDIDNVLHIVTDALNGIAYEDDKQIVTVAMAKYYSMVPQVMLTIEKYKQED